MRNKNDLIIAVSFTASWSHAFDDSHHCIFGSQHKALPVNTGCSKTRGEHVHELPQLPFPYYINCSLGLGTRASGICRCRMDTNTCLNLLPSSLWGTGHFLCSGLLKLLSHDHCLAMKWLPLSHCAIKTFKIVKKKWYLVNFSFRASSFHAFKGLHLK